MSSSSSSSSVSASSTEFMPPSMFENNACCPGKRETDWIKLVAIITVVALAPIAVFAGLTATGYFPPALLGGVYGASAVAGVSGFLVVVGGAVIWIRWDSSKPKQAEEEILD